jgi:hypothetical protein
MKKDKKKCLVISTLAEYQTEFWLRIANEIRLRNVECRFISFDDRSTELLRKNDFLVYSVTDFIQCYSKNYDESDFNFFGISDLDKWFLHERVTFEISDVMYLRRKLMAALNCADSALKEISESGFSPIMIQELGGFLSVIGCFFSAKKNNVDNFFLEPSFFRGRFFFLKNSFSAPIINISKKSKMNFNCESSVYLQENILNKSIVIPLKDKHHYTSATSKILNLHNFRRLITKLYDKYFLKKKQEFSYVFVYVKKHIRMFFNTLLLKASYSKLEDGFNFIYFPLHVPADVALTIRSPSYLDQILLIDNIARNLPWGYKIGIKEHPAMIGAIGASRLKRLKNSHKDVFIFDPKINNFELIKKSVAVISINSKSGAEAIMLGRKALVLGDAFYINAPYVKSLADISQLKSALENLITDKEVIQEKLVLSYFEAVWEKSYPGELYIVKDKNIKTFTDSILLEI